MQELCDERELKVVILDLINENRYIFCVDSEVSIYKVFVNEVLE